MKLLHIIPSMNPDQGGPCQGIRNLVPSLELLGCHNEVVSLDDPLSDFIQASEFRIHALGQGHGPWFKNSKLYPWLLEKFELYDSIILHNLWLYHSYAATKAMARHRRSSGSSQPKMFVMPHGMLDPWFQTDPSRRLKAWRNWAYWKLIERRTIQEADGVLFTCEKELELAREPFRPYQPKRELNVGYGIEEPPKQTLAMTDAFRARVSDLGDRPYLLFLSRIHPKKGVDMLLRSYAEVVESEHERNLPALVIAGPLETDYAKEMQKLASRLGLSNSREELAGSDLARDQAPRVVFPGMLQGDAKWGAFYGCDAFVLPSHQENFGIAVAEALACGKPVLISDQVNICVEIKQANAGFVEPCTADGTKRLIVRWLNRQCDSREYERVALDCYRQYFGCQNAAEKLASTLNTICYPTAERND